MVFDPAAALQAGFNNMMNTALDTKIGNPNLPELAEDAAIVGAIQSAVAQGALSQSVATAAQASINRAVDNVPLNMGDGKAIMQAMIDSEYRNPDGTSNGKMNEGFLHLIDNTVSALDPTATSPILLGGHQAILKNTAKDMLADWAQEDPAIAALLMNTPPEVLELALDQAIAGDLLGAGRTAVLDAILPFVTDRLLNATLGEILTWNIPWAAGSTPGMRPPILGPGGVVIFGGLPDTWHELPLPTSTAQTDPYDGNVGHKGHMTVKLGGLSFEIPPAVSSILPVNGGTGQQVPGVQPGISFKHINNYASLLIPGSAPIYQALGYQGHAVEFVGAFLGFDADRLLNAELHNQEPYAADGPDPYYVGDTKKGGAWAVSRAFQDLVDDQLPKDFEIFSGIVRIRYSLIVLNFERLYDRDDRVWYRFQCLAIGSAELPGEGRARPRMASVPVKPPATKGLPPSTNGRVQNPVPAAGSSGTAGGTSTPANAASPVPSASDTTRTVLVSPATLTSFITLVKSIEQDAAAFHAEYGSTYPLSDETVVAPVLAVPASGTLAPKVKAGSWNRIVASYDKVANKVTVGKTSFTKVQADVTKAVLAAIKTNTSAAKAQETLMFEYKQRLDKADKDVRYSYNRGVDYIRATGGVG